MLTISPPAAMSGAEAAKNLKPKGCPFHTAKAAESNSTWWPNKLQMSSLGKGLAPKSASSYAEDFLTLDLDAVKADLTALMTDSQEVRACHIWESVAFPPRFIKQIALPRFSAPPNPPPPPLPSNSGGPPTTAPTRPSLCA